MRLRKYFRNRKRLENISLDGICKHLEYCAWVMKDNNMRDKCIKNKEDICEVAKFYKRYGENGNKMYI